MVALLVITEILLVSFQVVTSCQVYPSEYAYRSDSFYKIERSSANCRRYLEGGQLTGIHPEFYTYCNGTNLRLTDSDLGSELYNSSDYYQWIAGSSRQLLFIFPIRVNLTTITLHYYSNNGFGLPRLRFYAVPDDFEIWNALRASYSSVDVAAVLPGGELAGRRNVSIAFNISTKRILMYKYRSDFTFAVSEVEFRTLMTTTIATETMKPTTKYKPLPEISILETTLTGDVSLVNFHTMAVIGSVMYTEDQNTKTNSFHHGETAAAWGLFAIMTVLFIVSLTVNVIMVVLWVYKKREVKGQNGQCSEFEIEGNPCYEATQMNQTTETETHLYETVQGKRGK